MLRVAVLSAAFVGFALPALAESTTPVTPPPAETVAVTEATPVAQGTKIKSVTSGYSGCSWGAKITPTS